QVHELAVVALVVQNQLGRKIWAFAEEGRRTGERSRDVQKTAVIPVIGRQRLQHRRQEETRRDQPAAENHQIPPRGGGNLDCSEGPRGGGVRVWADEEQKPEKERSRAQHDSKRRQMVSCFGRDEQRGHHDGRSEVNQTIRRRAFSSKAQRKYEDDKGRHRPAVPDWMGRNSLSNWHYEEIQRPASEPVKIRQFH